jgi:flagellar biosynthetic protein FliQ
MTVDMVKDISAEAIKAILITAGPALLVSMVVGLAIGFFQAITQIQEFTLTFVPKIIAVFLCIFFLLPWMASGMITFTTNLIEKIPVYLK